MDNTILQQNTNLNKYSNAVMMNNIIVRLSPESAYMFYKNIAHKFMGLTRV